VVGEELGRWSSSRIGGNEQRGLGSGPPAVARGASYSALRGEVSPADLRSSIRASQPDLAESHFSGESGSAEKDRPGLPINN
jgi:hypothetical protein